MDEGYPIIIPFSGRTEEGLKESLEKAKELAGNQDAVGLLHNAFRRNIPGHEVRGHVVVTKDAETKMSIETLKGTGEARPLWFVFPGMGSQWNESNHYLHTHQNVVQNSFLLLFCIITHNSVEFI